MKECGSNDDEGKKEVECEKSGQGGIVHREAASDSLNQGFSNVRDGGKKVSNNGGASKRHLSSWEDIADKCGYYNKEKKDYSDVSGFQVKI